MKTKMAALTRNGDKLWYYLEDDNGIAQRTLVKVMDRWKSVLYPGMLWLELWSAEPGQIERCLALTLTDGGYMFDTPTPEQEWLIGTARIF